MNGSIVWLASYPKSGNTWLRAMLTALIDPQLRLNDLNDMVGGTEMNARQFLDDLCGVDSSNLPYARLRPWLRAMRLAVAAQVEPPYFVKTHDAYAETDDGESLFPAEASRLVVHIVRHPCDVAISFAAHNGTGIDAAITRMADPEYMLNAGPHQGGQFLPVAIGDWSGHATSWLEQKEVPALLLRYEDLIADPLGALAKVADASGLMMDAAALRSAVAAADFGRLRAAEREAGFAEKPAGMVSFFREGRAGAWRDQLTTPQAEAIRFAHGAAMQRLGYE